MKKLFCIGTGGMNKATHSFPRPIVYQKDTSEAREAFIDEIQSEKIETGI